jgi:uncharacterized protein YggE
MKQGKMFLGALALLIHTLAGGQVMGNFQYRTQQVFRQAEVQQNDRRPVTTARIANNHELTITVNGLANVMATNYVAVFNVIQVAPDMQQTVELMQERIDSFSTGLQALGVNPANIHIDMISFVPRYDYRFRRNLFSRNYNEVPAGFELQQNISVKYKNTGLLPSIIAAAAASEIYDIVKVDYFIDNIDLYIDSLRRGCLAEVVKREQGMRVLGFRADTLRKVMAEDFTTIYPPTRYFSYQAFSRPSLEAAHRRAGRKEQLPPPETKIETDKAISRFYQQVHYDYYDMVTRPVVSEPVIQISLSITVKYFLKDDPAPQNNRYFMITPTGDLRHIDPR